jgi:phage terminase large subunit-like protein
MDDGRFRYEVRQWSFLAPNTRRDLSKSPWSGWLWNSKIRQSKQVIAQIRDEVIAFALEWGCTGLVFDPHNARQLGDDLEQQGLPPIAMPQTCGHYNEPLKELFAAIDDGRFLHDGDPVLSWAAANLTVYENTRGEIMPDKGAAAEKIDPMVAVIMAFRGAYFSPGNASTYYESNPVEMA